MSNSPQSPDIDELLSTKIAVPPLRASIVPRDPLLRRLIGGLNAKLTLVSAPAGFGKTTLVVEWLESLKVGWLAWQLSLFRGVPWSGIQPARLGA